MLAIVTSERQEQGELVSQLRDSATHAEPDESSEMGFRGCVMNAGDSRQPRRIDKNNFNIRVNNSGLLLDINNKFVISYF